MFFAGFVVFFFLLLFGCFGRVVGVDGWAGWGFVSGNEMGTVVRRMVVQGILIDLFKLEEFGS